MSDGGVFLIKVSPKDPKTGKVTMLEPWMATALALAANSKAEALAEAQRVRFAFKEQKRGLKYFVEKIAHYKGPTRILALETLGGVQLSQQHVSEANPGAQPQGQRGQNKLDSVRDQSGFVSEGDAGLEVSQDAYYGPPSEGAYTDLINNHGAMIETQRGG